MMTPEYRHLSKVDPVLKRIIQIEGNLPPVQPKSGFAMLAIAVINQQLSTTAAATIRGRLCASLKGGKLTPESIEKVSNATMLNSGLSRAKTSYLKALAVSFSSGTISTRRLAQMDDESALEVLCQLKGVGVWTAQMFLMFKLNRQDIFPVGDAGLRRAMTIAYELPDDASLEEFENIGSRWRPYRTVGSRLLWYHLSKGRLKK